MDIQKTMQNLEKNGIKPYFVENKDEVVPLVKTLINNGESVSCGGSVTLDETGVKALMQNGDYDFIDRTGLQGDIEDPGVAADEVKLGDDEYFVLGDNRNSSEDSRMANIGNVKKDYIIGKAWFHFKGFGKMGLID